MAEVHWESRETTTAQAQKSRQSGTVLHKSNKILDQGTNNQSTLNRQQHELSQNMEMKRPMTNGHARVANTKPCRLRIRSTTLSAESPGWHGREKETSRGPRLSPGGLRPPHPRRDGRRGSNVGNTGRGRQRERTQLCARPAANTR
jgi:hypothetical protein